MTWKQCTLPIEESCERIRDGVELLAAAAHDAPDVALFSRTTADRRHRVLLLSPRAVERASEALSARWSDSDTPEVFEWDLIVGCPEAHEHLGLASPRFGRDRPASPVFLMGGDPRPQPDDHGSPRSR